MDQQTRIELSMMVLDLRLAAPARSAHVGMRLGPERLQDIAMVLEQLLDRNEPLSATLKTHPANDTSVPARIVAGLSWRR